MSNDGEILLWLLTNSDNVSWIKFKHFISEISKKNVMELDEDCYITNYSILRQLSDLGHCEYSFNDNKLVQVTPPMYS